MDYDTKKGGGGKKQESRRRREAQQPQTETGAADSAKVQLVRQSRAEEQRNQSSSHSSILSYLASTSLTVPSQTSALFGRW